MAVDGFLQLLVAAVERAKNGIGITLAIHGVLISGDLTTVEDYANWFNLRIKAEVEQVEPPRVGETYAPANLISREEVGKQQYIHLRNVRIVAPGGATTAFAGQMYWRGKLEDVNGFLIGRIGDQVGEPM